jgi:hypothetical protein
MPAGRFEKILYAAIAILAVIMFASLTPVANTANTVSEFATLALQESRSYPLIKCLDCRVNCFREGGRYIELHSLFSFSTFSLFELRDRVV